MIFNHETFPEGQELAAIGGCGVAGGYIHKLIILRQTTTTQ